MRLHHAAAVLPTEIPNGRAHRNEDLGRLRRRSGARHAAEPNDAVSAAAGVVGAVRPVAIVSLVGVLADLGRHGSDFATVLDRDLCTDELRAETARCVLAARDARLQGLATLCAAHAACSAVADIWDSAASHFARDFAVTALGAAS